MKSLIAAALLSMSPGGAAAFAAEQTVKLDVQGMTCISCVYSVESALRSVDGVKKVEVLGHKSMALVTFDDTKGNVDKLVAAVTNVGFPAKLMAQAKLAPQSGYSARKTQ